MYTNNLDYYSGLSSNTCGGLLSSNTSIKITKLGKNNFYFTPPSTPGIFVFGYKSAGSCSVLIEGKCNDFCTRESTDIDSSCL